MVLRLTILTISVLYLSHRGNAQTDYLLETLPELSSSNNHIDSNNNRLNYSMTPDIEGYLNFTDSLDKKSDTRAGYRIQIYSNSGPQGRTNAIKEQSNFLRLYQEIPSYTKWNYPNWCVRVGDFRTKLEALEFHMTIRELYPASFIMSDNVEVKY